MSEIEEPVQTKDELDGGKSMKLRLLLAPLTYIAALVFSAWFFTNSGPLKIFEISIPLAALWFGALGGVISSLQGMFLWRNKWNNNYNLWHVFSGGVGATYGIVSYLFLVVIVNAGTSTPPKIDSPVFALGAFAIGYAQTQFHAMIEKVFAVLFQPAKKPGDSDSG